MNKTAMTAAAAAFSTLSLTGASAQETGNAADKCVWNEFNTAVQQIDLMEGVTIKLNSK